MSGLGRFLAGKPVPDSDDLVWVATHRRGIDFHKPDPRTPKGVDGQPNRTVCERSTRTGSWLDKTRAVDLFACKPCRRCYPPDGA